MGKLGKDALVKQIAKDLYLREDVVEEVLERFVDIAVEEIVNEGEFKIHRLLSVSSADYKGYQAGKGYVPPQTRLKVRLSDGIHRLFKLRQEELKGAKGQVTRDNWKHLLAGIADRKKAAKEPTPLPPDHPLYNPMLDEDD